MTVKSLKKQLAAAIAMVVVAAVALSSSTYAWFVSNNTVKATTATISAQSNAPFLMIDKEAIDAESTTSITFVQSPAVDTKLYPAQVVVATGSEVYPNGETTATMNANEALFQSAYAQASTDTTMLTKSRYNVGPAEVAVSSEFALHERFYIGTSDPKAGSFKELKVSKVELVNESASDLSAALSVLVVGPDGWAVYKATEDGTVLAEYHDSTPAGGYHASSNVGILDDVLEASGSNQATIDVYVFYDGSEEKVFTDNLTNLKAIGATITFTATPVNTQGADVDASNGV